MDFSVFFKSIIIWLFYKRKATVDRLFNAIQTMDGYKWEDDDPQIYLTFNGYGRFSGFYMLEIGVSRKSPGTMFSQLYCSEGGRGFSEEKSLSLPIRSKKVTKRIVWLDDVNGLRWDPSLEPGSLSNLTIKLVKITDSFARDRMLKKMDSFKSIENRVALTIEDLYQVYDSRFSCFKDKQNNYLNWRLNFETESMLLERSAECVKISIILPVYNPEAKYLRLCLQSVINQTYKKWELCIADDASNLEIIEILNEFQEKDHRIKVSFRESNGHISKASNTAIGISSGDYALLLDHDDVLVKTALNEVVCKIIENKKLKLIYSDEDKIDEMGERFEPHFKPDFSPDLLLSQNYISHATVLSMELIKKVGGFRVGYEGSQDHDLLLRCLPYLNESNVIHIPKVLYHWRAVEGSTALASCEKSYTEVSGLKAVASYISNYQYKAEACSGEGANTYRIKWPIMGEPLVSLIVPTRDGLNVLKPCIDSILEKTNYQNFEVLILDNDSQKAETKEYFDIIKADKRIKIIKSPGEFNYSKINNQGVNFAKGSVVGLINNDIEVIDGDLLTELLSQALRKDVGCVGAKLLYQNGKIQHGGVILGMGGVANHSHLNCEGSAPGYFERMRTVHNVSAVTGACLFVKKSIYESVGGLNDTFLKVAFNDIDFCLKVREKGYRNLFTPFATLYHHESVSRGYDITPEKQERFASEVQYMKNTWGESLYTDPYYNINFDLSVGVDSYTIQQ